MIGRAAELMPKSGRRVVVIGGGYGGTIAAKYVRMLDKSIEVVMIERNKQFVSCPFSNFYIAGLTNDMNSLTIGYDKLTANHGVKMVYAEVTDIDPAAKKVVTSQGTLDYDRLIVSPGIDFRTLPRATLQRGFSTASSLGMGFTIMLQVCERVLLSTHPGRTTVVLEFAARQPVAEDAEALDELDIRAS